MMVRILAIVCFLLCREVVEDILPVVVAADNEAVVVQTLFLEAGGEGLPGMRAVGEVIRNRARMTQDSFQAVCLRKYQFSCYNPGKEARKAARRLAGMTGADWQVARMAWEESRLSNSTHGATHYANLEVCQPSWAGKMRRVARVGKHTFYKEV